VVDHDGQDGARAQQEIAADRAPCTFGRPRLFQCRNRHFLPAWRQVPERALQRQRELYIDQRIAAQRLETVLRAHMPRIKRAPEGGRDVVICRLAALIARRIEKRPQGRKIDLAGSKPWQPVDVHHLDLEGAEAGHGQGGAEDIVRIPIPEFTPHP
jgi:hypothetical protein